MPSDQYLAGNSHLHNGSKGNFLAQWYAHECFSNSGFLASDNDEWVKSKLIAEFHCPGLSESDIRALIDDIFAERKGAYVRENVQTLENESADGSRQREVNVLTFSRTGNVEARYHAETDARPSRIEQP